MEEKKHLLKRMLQEKKSPIMNQNLSKPYTEESTERTLTGYFRNKDIFIKGDIFAVKLILSRREVTSVSRNFLFIQGQTHKNDILF